MYTPHRIASIAATLSATIALAGTAQASTVRLIPLTPATVGASISTCSRPAAIADAAPADVPTIAAEQHVTGITGVLIALDARGRLTGQSVLTSSGNRYLDRAALMAARLSRFSAEVRDCAPVGGTYAFVVDFTQ
jgi:periplasmic protein TonB